MAMAMAMASFWGEEHVDVGAHLKSGAQDYNGPDIKNKKR